MKMKLPLNITFGKDFNQKIYFLFSIKYLLILLFVIKLYKNYKEPLNCIPSNTKVKYFKYYPNEFFIFNTFYFYKN